MQITEIVVYEPGRRLEIRMVDGPPVDGRWDFAPSGAGTLLTFTPIFRVTGIMQRLEPMLVLATRAVFWRFHRRLKRALEVR